MKKKILFLFLLCFLGGETQGKAAFETRCWQDREYCEKTKTIIKFCTRYVVCALTWTRRFRGQCDKDTECRNNMQHQAFLGHLGGYYDNDFNGAPIEKVDKNQALRVLAVTLVSIFGILVVTRVVVLWGIKGLLALMRYYQKKKERGESLEIDNPQQIFGRQ